MIVECPNCDKARRTRKDLLAKALKEGKTLMCKSCAIKLRPVTWKKNPEDLWKNQGAYKSYARAKRRVEVNHKGAYGHVEFRFKSYDEFLTELGPRPDGMTLDRIDSNGHYERGNVRWASHRDQCRNRRNNVMFLIDGERLCLVDAAKKAGINRDTVTRRMKKGIADEFLFFKGRLDL